MCVTWAGGGCVLCFLISLQGFYIRNNGINVHRLEMLRKKQENKKTSTTTKQTFDHLISWPCRPYPEITSLLSADHLNMPK